MIEAIMYFEIGFLFAALMVLIVIPLVHGRAVRLTVRRLEAGLPRSMAEIQADKDLLRAEFAMSTRRLEKSVEQLKNKNTSQLVELGKKSDAINRFKIEHEAKNVEIVALKAQVEALTERFAHAGSSGSSLLIPPLTDRRLEGDVKELPVTEDVQPGGSARDPDAGRGSSDWPIAMARKRSNFSAGFRAVEPLIPVSRTPAGFNKDRFARPSIGRRIFRSHAGFFIAALLGVGAMFVWQIRGDKAKEMIRTWAPSMTSLPSVSISERPSAPALATGATSPELVQQLKEAIARDLAAVQDGVEHLTDKQEQMAYKIAALQAAEMDIIEKMSSHPLQTRAYLAPAPETKPTTIEGWTLLEVTNGTAILEGPNGIWRAARGDTVPGVGRVDSIVRWGNRWIVATSSGLISTP